MNRTEEPPHPMPVIDPAVALSTRQEAFCRHYAASGNAADAARQAGYSERSARQTGCALLEPPWSGFLANVTACVALSGRWRGWAGGR